MKKLTMVGLVAALIVPAFAGEGDPVSGTTMMIDRLLPSYSGSIGRYSGGTVTFGKVLKPGVREMVFGRYAGGSRATCRGDLKGTAEVVDGKLNFTANDTMCGVYIFAVSPDARTLTLENDLGGTLSAK